MFDQKPLNTPTKRGTVRQPNTTRTFKIYQLMFPVGFICFAACATTKTAPKRTQPEHIKSMSVSGPNMCVLTSTDQVYCMGDKPNEALLKIEGLPPINALALSPQHTCALTKTGGVFCWGDSEFGQAGTATKIAKKPVKMQNLPPITAIALGREHSCALAKTGHVYCWGQNYAGELGRGDDKTSDEPDKMIDQDHKPAKVVKLSGVVELKTHYNSTIAKDKFGKLFAWGKLDFAPLIYNDEDLPNDLCNAEFRCGTTPYQWRQEHKTTKVAVGFSHVCTLTEGNDVLCSNQHGQVPNKTAPYHKTNETRQMTKVLSQAKSIHQSPWRTCAITEKNAVYCWGSDIAREFRFPFSNYGIEHHTPREIKQLKGSEQLIINTDQVCGLKSGKVTCWVTTKQSQPKADDTSKTRFTRKDTYTTLAGMPKLDRLVPDTSICGFTANNELWCVSGRVDDKTFPKPQQIRLPSKAAK